MYFTGEREDEILEDSSLFVFCSSVLISTAFPMQVRNAMDRARMNSAIRVFNEAVVKNDFDGMVSEKVLHGDENHVHLRK